MMKGNTGLPHLPLWIGAKYRLVIGVKILIAQLVEVSQDLQYPKKHVFQLIDECKMIDIIERRKGLFLWNGEVCVVTLTK